MDPEIQTARAEVQRCSTRVDMLTTRIYAKQLPAADEPSWQQLALAELARQKAVADLGEIEKTRAIPEAVLVGGGARSQTARVMGRETTGIEVQVKLRLERIPTSIIHLFDVKNHPLISFKLENIGKTPRRLRITTYVEGYSASSIETVEVAGNGAAELSQLLTFFPHQLRQVTELTRATLHLKVDDLDGKQELYTTRPVWLLARDSAYLSMQDPSTGKPVDLAPYLAAWVTPHSEEVLVLLREAADVQPQVVVGGYQGDAEFVERQVRAVFEALKARRIVYVNSVICFGAGPGEHMQRVRLPRESLAKRSANCIDGTVLFASVLEAASLSTAILIVPGHALLGWQIQDGGDWDYIETTLIESADFATAQRVGRELIRRHEKLAGATGRQLLRRIPIAQARANFGITPME
jgi:hypothetical protein